MAKKKAKLPKKILGVKVPKQVRRGPFAEFLMSPVGQTVVAEAIYHGGAAFARSQARGDSAVGSVARHPLSSLAEAGLTTKNTAARLTGAAEGGASNLHNALSEAARHFMVTLQEGQEEVSDGAESSAGKKNRRNEDSDRVH